MVDALLPLLAIGLSLVTLLRHYRAGGGQICTAQTQCPKSCTGATTRPESGLIRIGAHRKRETIPMGDALNV